MLKLVGQIDGVVRLYYFVREVSDGVCFVIPGETSTFFIMGEKEKTMAAQKKFSVELTKEEMALIEAAFYANYDPTYNIIKKIKGMAALKKLTDDVNTVIEKLHNANPVTPSVSTPVNPTHTNPAKPASKKK